jgi:hypothetical protein
MAALYTLLLAPKFRAVDLAGAALSGGRVYIYEAGTTTPKASYADAQNSAQNPWPVILDTYGMADIWVPGPYKIVVTDSDGVQLYTVDSLYGFGGAYVSMPAQSSDKLLAWGTVDGEIVNSELTLADIEDAVRAFDTVTMLDGGLVAADVGDESAGVLNDKLDVGPGLTKIVLTESLSKKVYIDAEDQVGATLSLAQTCGAF